MQTIIRAKRRVQDLKQKVAKVARIVIKIQCQILWRLILCSTVSFVVLIVFRPAPVEYSVNPEFKTIDNQHKTILWRDSYYQHICSKPRSEIGVYWTQKCIFSQNRLPYMRSKEISVTVNDLQPDKVHSVKLCRFIRSINKMVCEEKYVQYRQVVMNEATLEDVVLLEIVLGLQSSAYFSNPTIVISNDVNFLTLFVHRHYILSSLVLATVFSIIVGLYLIFVDVYKQFQNDQQPAQPKIAIPVLPKTLPITKLSVKSQGHPSNRNGTDPSTQMSQALQTQSETSVQVQPKFKEQ